MKLKAAIKTSQIAKANLPDKALRVLASSIYQSLRDEGCQEKDIIGVSSQLIKLVTSALSTDVPSVGKDFKKDGPGRY